MVNWYKLSQSNIEPLYIASDLSPEIISEYGFIPQYNPDKWGMGAHLMPPSIFLANEEAIKRYHFISDDWKKSRPYLYKIINLDRNAFYPDIPSLVDLGAYFEEEAVWLSEVKQEVKEKLSPFFSEEGTIYFDEIFPYSIQEFAKVLFDVTGTIAYTKAIPPEDVEFLEKL
jgi:hypothetical protein